MTRLAVAISTCPNDTYVFAGLLVGAVRVPELDVALELCDIAELNARLFAGRDDVLKVSFHAALRAREDVLVLPVGAALGYGVGPVVLSARPWPAGRVPERVLAPGPETTAALLFEALHPEAPPLDHCLFSEIMPALSAGVADWGICIHEGRFTWQQQGLALVEDLGQRFEAANRAPLPLGGLVARRQVDESLLACFVELVRRSLSWAVTHPDEVVDVMRRYAQEHADGVLWEHVRLYVNAATYDLGKSGRSALAAFCEWAERAGRVPPHSRLTFFESPSDAFERPARLFHLAPREAWSGWASRGPQRGAWEPPSLALEGFCHLSLGDQLAGTLEAHFAAERELVLVELDPGRLAGALRMEPSRGGAIFPHVYRPLTAADCVGQWLLRRTDAGWSLPQLASEPEADRPPASPAPAA